MELTNEQLLKIFTFLQRAHSIAWDGGDLVLADLIFPALIKAREKVITLGRILLDNSGEGEDFHAAAIECGAIPSDAEIAELAKRDAREVYEVGNETNYQNSL